MAISYDIVIQQFYPIYLHFSRLEGIIRPNPFNLCSLKRKEENEHKTPVLAQLCCGCFDAWINPSVMLSGHCSRPGPISIGPVFLCVKLVIGEKSFTHHFRLYLLFFSFSAGQSGHQSANIQPHPYKRLLLCRCKSIWGSLRLRLLSSGDVYQSRRVQLPRLYLESAG